MHLSSELLLVFCFSGQDLRAFPICPLGATRLAHLMLLDLIILAAFWRGAQIAAVRMTQLSSRLTRVRVPDCRSDLSFLCRVYAILKHVVIFLCD